MILEFLASHPISCCFVCSTVKFTSARSRIVRTPIVQSSQLQNKDILSALIVNTSLLSDECEYIDSSPPTTFPFLFFAQLLRSKALVSFRTTNQTTTTITAPAPMASNGGIRRNGVISFGGIQPAARPQTAAPAPSPAPVQTPALVAPLPSPAEVVRPTVDDPMDLDENDPEEMDWIYYNTEWNAYPMGLRPRRIVWGGVWPRW